MRSITAAIVAVILALCAGPAGRGEAASKTELASLTITKAPAMTSAYTGSQCDSNTLSGQCPSENCQCIVVSGNFCNGKVGRRSGKNGACSLFLTIDNGLATGSPGCTPLFGVITGFLIGESEGFFVGTVCPVTGSNFSGGWVLDNGAGFSAGEGTFTGTVDDTLTLKLKGTLTLE